MIFKKKEVNPEENVAATLREIVASSPVGTERFIKAAKKAAGKGLTYSKLQVELEDYTCLVNKTTFNFQREQYDKKIATYKNLWIKENIPEPKDETILTPIVEKLLDLGFQLEASEGLSLWDNKIYYITLHW